MSDALTRVEVVRIGDDEVAAVRGADGQGYAVVRRMCEALGVDDDAQRVKLKNAVWAVTRTIKATAEDGKNYVTTKGLEYFGARVGSPMLTHEVRG
jgi:hypothetical protein